MKPSWDDAPEWAKYLAMDEDGEWWWYEMEPIKCTFTWSSGGKIKLAECEVDYWGDSLEQRP